MLAQMRALGYLGDDAGDPEGGGDDGADEDDEPPGDWLHTNGIDYHAGQDVVLLSVRTFSEVWVIDHSTTSEEAAGSTGGRFGRGGDLLYRWGNPRRYGAGDEGDRRLFVQHDGRFVAPDDPSDLRFTVFNNGSGRPGGDASTVDEVEPPFEPGHGFERAPGAAFGPPAPSWSYPSGDAPSFYSSFISGAQRLPNGNTLICAGPEGRLLEVTRAGRIVWDYWNPFGGEDADESIPKGLFRGERLAPDHPGLRGRALAPE
jgi:hypothetical protein